MQLSESTFERFGTTVLYLVVGSVATLVAGLAVLYVAQPVQRLVYDLFYLQVGPSEATETAILTHFLFAATVALAVSSFLGDAVSDRLANRARLIRGFAWMVASLFGFLLLAITGLAALPTALVTLAVGVVAVPLTLRYRYGVHSGAVPAFVGGIPVVVGLLLLAGFGIGWGWGYVVTAEEVPPGTGNGTAVEFEELPAVRADLFAGDCETTAAGQRQCYLELRGYEHERAAVRFMARQGVRCPYQNAAASRSGSSFIAHFDGRYYRITCSPHGD